MINRYLLALLLSVFISAFSQIVLKKSASREHGSLIKEYLNPYVITGYAMMVLATLCTIYAYSGMQYKNGPVIESFGYVLVMFLSFAFFKEPITWKKALGNALVIIGIIVFYI